MLPPAAKGFIDWPQRFADQVVYSDAYACALLDGQTGWLVYYGHQAAGAIGHDQGESLLNAVRCLPINALQRLVIGMNSAGAHFQQPMEGLAYLNEWLEALWAWKAQGVEIIVLSDGWVYGGMALALASVAHTIYLTESANMGLFGTLVLKQAERQAVPACQSGMMGPVILKRLPTYLFEQIYPGSAW